MVQRFAAGPEPVVQTYPTETMTVQAADAGPAPGGGTNSGRRRTSGASGRRRPATGGAAENALRSAVAPAEGRAAAGPRASRPDHRHQALTTRRLNDG
ncbi:hypothetical protein [Fodinicola feengrottensis]|uniref:hypothetical protein n=1 Tax=Fodinicola feengrottensis TaxID=435914 RepID=UPI0013D6F609|nr:hypothetical protein [Fodinicola feengrottensis]